MKVRKYFSIFFLAVYMLSSNFEISELLKIPLLLQHYNEHKQWDSGISMAEFMYMHYFDEVNKFGDQERDMEMPFKTTAHSCVVTAGFIIPSIEHSIIAKALVREREPKLLPPSSSYSSQYLSSIWQPPRSC